MVASDTTPDLFWAHGRAAKAAAQSGIDIARVAKTLGDCWRLRTSAGSKIKNLRVAFGMHHRLRLGKCRAAFTVRQRSACIHVFGTRDKIYETDSFEDALRRFDTTFMGGTDLQPDSLRALGYEQVSVAADTAAYPANDPAWALSIGVMLRPQQQAFFNSVLPLDGTLSESNPRLVIGYGPPGSGKTVVGADLAVESVMDGHRVDILVPTRSLRDEYERLLASAGIAVATSHGSGPGVRVLRFDEYFADRVAQPAVPDRESRIFGMVRGFLDKPAPRARIGAMRRQIDAEKAKERLPVLVDALVDDESWWDGFGAWCGKQKDPIIEPLVPYLRLLAELRQGLIDDIGDDLPATRAALAAAPPAGDRPQARLVIADEAQDLAPAEWRTLLDDAFVRLHPDLDRRVVLLGDLRQRVNLVPFAWDDITTFARMHCKLDGRHVRDVEVDSTSYRMRREIARAAGSVFQAPLRPPGKYRMPPTLDPARLPEGGKIEVAVIDRTREVLERALSERAGHGPTNGYLFMVHGREVARPAQVETDIVNYSVREAKGLEADSIVVHLPFGVGFRPAKDGTVANDDATEFYTAMSRARDRVLLVVDRGTWSTLARAGGAWDGTEILEGGNVTSAGLARALDRARVGLSTAQAVDARLRQIEAAANDPGLAGDAVLTTFAEAIKDLARLVRLAAADPAQRLTEIGAALASVNAPAFETLRAAYRAGGGRSERTEDVAWLLLFGELAAAATRAGAPDAAAQAGWDPEWLALLRDESSLQRFRAGVPVADGPVVWTDEHAEATMVASAIRAFNAAPDMRVPLSPPAGIRRRDIGQAAGIGEPAADTLAHRRVAETRARIAARLEAEERRVLGAIDDHARTRGAAIAARLGRIEATFGGNVRTG